MRALADLVDPAALVPDLAGHGAGPHSTDPADYTVDAMADAVLALAGQRCDLVGYSMGGRVALTAACRHPERVRSLTLIGASAGLAD
ncbi:MAG TPA: 2-succinyl-6-hydroxy-2,4-cyclohexadiene-1-carboxylate synthase, partial [Acidimicrobiaceae bacterium]|nr:2-succinyl-6-hydroxy-2,4-cyclohexadiene-1-carboxylate synthase [Acidimicrobiaceae bacterium]